MNLRPSRVTTIRPQNGIYQLNLRADAMTHQRLEKLRAYYTDLTGLKTNTGVVMRRAIRLLADQLRDLDRDRENQIIRQCGKGEEKPKWSVPESGLSLNK